MLYVALVGSAILLLMANLFAWRAKHPVRPTLELTFLSLIGFAPAVMCFFLPPLILQAVLLSVIFVIWAVRQGTPITFFLLSCAATLIAFVIPGYFAFRETRHLQEAFPFISMDDRLPQPKNQRPAEALPSAATARLGEMETFIENKDRTGMSYYRTSSLREIHEDAVQLFVNQPGFGVARMLFLVSEERLKRGTHEEPPIPQPGTPSASPWAPELLRKQPEEVKPPDDLFSLHRDNVVDFVNLPGFGYIKDRQHVAGFQVHQVSQAPALAKPWKLQTLDLVGLLLHEKPTAYVSEHLPRMDELLEAPTRNLDDFEAAGLLALRRGDDLFVRERGRERRMLGAIRAARQCLSCHEAERGDLLGAFSYRMTQHSQ